MCTADDCDRPATVIKRQLCSKHYYRWWKHGDPNQAAYDRNNDPERWLSMWEVVPSGCWLWTGRLDSQGYGLWQSTSDGVRTSTGAHRWVYQQLRCLLEPDEHLDHRCHTDDETCPGGKGDVHRRCVNPDHMEVVPHAVNASRARSHNARKTHCKNGHEFTPENTIARAAGGRNCRQCARDWHREDARRRRGTPNPTNNADKTHCVNGHEFTPENTYDNHGHRGCRECRRKAVRESQRRRRAAGLG